MADITISTLESGPHTCFWFILYGSNYLFLWKQRGVEGDTWDVGIGRLESETLKKNYPMHILRH